MTDAVDRREPTHKLPPLNIRPFRNEDYSQVRQLVADSKTPSKFVVLIRKIRYSFHV